MLTMMVSISCRAAPPVLHDSEAPWCHAVDTPVGNPLVVADRNGEAAVVGTNLDKGNVSNWLQPRCCCFFLTSTTCLKLW